MRANKHKYIINPNYLFEDDNVNDVANVDSHRPRFGPRSQHRKTSSTSETSAGGELRGDSFLKKKHKLLQQTLDTSMRSIALLNETETVGATATTDLHHQREQLENTNLKLDEIHRNLNQNKHSLMNIKSSYRVFKNFIFGRPIPNQQQRISNETNIVEEEKPKRKKFSFRRKSKKNGKPKEESFLSHPPSGGGNQQTNLNSPIDNHYNEEIESNLSEMAEAVLRLKTLGINLGEEIESQIRLLDIIEEKVEANDVRIVKQNKEINKILEK